MKVVIVVNSCDAYADLWDLFLLCLSDYWADCPYPIIINTERSGYSPPVGTNFNVSVHNFNSGPIDLWGARLRATLEDTDADLVIMLYDDFLLNAQVFQNRIESLISMMANDPEIGVIYLTKMLGVDKCQTRQDGLAVVGASTEYRLNSSPGIWRKDALLQYTGAQDNPWAWEYFGSYRTYRDKRTFLAVADGAEDIYSYDYRKGGAIYRGKWVSEVIDPIIVRHGLSLDVEKRGRVSSNEYPKRSFSWKVAFLAKGFQMIGAQMLLVVLRILRRKFVG